ncbi:Protein of unknown function [Cotesia congregata]|uniref:Uncharacterized protein n=1 Tax=Cotesia congregata TaxID=51543 RepID=A0A8J2H8L2_COTCN|nr:Protein of unknown function [Cotesia congregata]
MNFHLVRKLSAGSVGAIVTVNDNLDQDFDFLYPGKHEKALERWPKLRSFLVSKLRRPDDDPEEYTDDEKSTIVLMNLIKLFSPDQTIKQKKESKSFKPSGKEMQNAFMLHVKTIANIDANVSKRIEKLSQHNYTLQPYAVIVGPTIYDVSQSFVYVFKDYKYSVSSPFDAFISVFKCITALHAVYLPEIMQVWQFIHRALWDLPFNPKKEQSYNNVETLLKQFQRYKIQQPYCLNYTNT